MALTWSVGDIENWDEVCHIIATVDWPMDGTKKGDKLLNPVTSALIWHSLNTGIGRIKAENAGEVFARIKLVEDLYGPSLRSGDGTPRPITKDDIVQHIGLSTNASFKDESRASFLKRHVTRKLDESKREFERHIEQNEAARLACRTLL